MKDSYCTNYCIRSGLCNAIFLAYNNTENEILKFNWCAVYNVDSKNLNITTLDRTTTVSVVNTWAKHGGIPQESKLIILGILCIFRKIQECIFRKTGLKAGPESQWDSFILL